MLPAATLLLLLIRRCFADYAMPPLLRCFFAAATFMLFLSCYAAAAAVIISLIFDVAADFR